MYPRRTPKPTGMSARGSAPLPSLRRNIAVALSSIAILALAALILSSAIWTCAVALALAIVTIVLFRGERWQTAGLLVASIAAGLLVISVVAAWLLPNPMGHGLKRIAVPDKWIIPDPVLGYRLSPGTTVLMTATYDGDTLYRVLYTIGADGNRITPSAATDADTYLFMGDSFVFGDALADSQSLPAQFSAQAGLKAKATNLAVPGYAPNHWVRALEAGLLDIYIDKRVKAVVTWIIPAQLERVTGDSPWLGSSPQYVLADGTVHFTGSFTLSRWRNPVAGAAFVGRQYLPFLRLLGEQQRQEQQADLFVALLARLQQLVREKFGAPLVVLYSWPDEASGPNYSDSSVAQPLLVATLARIRALGIPLVSVNRLIVGMPLSQIVIPHDGHPTADVNRLAAEALWQSLDR